MKLAATAAGIFVLAAAGIAGAQDNRSLTDSEIRTPQVIVGGSDVSEALGDGPLYERLLLAQNSIRALTQSLAIANGEAEMFKRQAADLSLKLQSLGIPETGEDSGKIEQRLLAAVRDLRLAKKDNEEVRSQLIRLSEAVIALIKTSDAIPAESRMEIETELRRTGEILGNSPTSVAAAPIEPTLSDAMVVDVRDDLSLVVANVGDRHGVKIGMPFEVLRDGKKIGDVKVIDVRDRISGAVVQNLESEKTPVKTGDRLRVNAR